MALSDAQLRTMLGLVRPHVFTAAKDIANRFDITVMSGVALRADASYHPSGRAVDFMTRSKTTGDSLSEHVKANAGPYNVIEVIWWQRIWTTERANQGWRPMKDRGSDTANHKDHVHVSFNASGGGTGSVTVPSTSGSTGVSCLLVFMPASACGAGAVAAAVGVLVKGFG